MERREFLGWLGTAGVAAMSMSAAGGAAAQGGGKVGAAAAPAAPAPATAPTAPAAPGPDAQDLMSMARRRYGAHLSDEQAAELLAALDRGLQSSAALRKAKLTNGDEPDFLFRAAL